MNRKKQYRWGLDADITLLTAVAAERPTTGQMWDSIAVSVNKQHPEANVDRRGCRDRFKKVLLPNWKAEDNKKANRYV
jgi:hypothetical protein